MAAAGEGADFTLILPLPFFGKGGDESSWPDFGVSIRQGHGSVQEEHLF